VLTIQMPVVFPPWPVEAGHKAEFDWVGAGDKDDGNRRCCGLGSKYCWWPERADHRHLALHEIGRHRWQWTITMRYPTVFDPHVLTFDIAFRKDRGEMRHRSAQSRPASGC